MDIRDMLIDGIGQLNDWLNEAVKDLSAEQMNWLPVGVSTSAGASSNTGVGHATTNTTLPSAIRQSSAGRRALQQAVVGLVMVLRSSLCRLAVADCGVA